MNVAEALNLIPWLVIAIFGIKLGIESILPRLGFVKIILVLPNYRFRTIWRRPEGDKIKIKHAGKEKSFDYDIRKVIFDQRNVPVAIYNWQTSSQIDLFSKGKEGAIDAELLDQLLTRSFNAGKLFAVRQQSRLEQLLMLTLIASAGSLLIGLMLLTKIMG